MATADAGGGSLDFDYIVVGAGSAGCLLANRLSRAHRVLVLEAGGKDDWIWNHIPVGYLYCIDNPRTDWRFRTQADPGIAGRSLIYPRGRVLGGCSSINGMLYLRGQAADYDGWAARGNPGWSWQDVLPVFKDVEDHHGGNSAFHGGSGSWRVEQQRLRWDVLDAFQAAAEQAGIPRTQDFNTGDNLGCGYFEVNQRRGVRWNASKAFLRPAMARDTLRVMTQAFVQTIDFDGRRATGVTFVHNGQRLQARAHRELILAAGSIGSAQLLQVSGVGPAGLLASVGLPMVHGLPGVGKNLQDHLQLRMIFKLHNAKTLNTLANSLVGKARMGLEYALFRTGPLSMAPSQLGAFAFSDPEQTRPNMEFHVQPLSLDKFGDPLHRFPAMTAAPCNLRPTSRGHVRITSPDIAVPPQILCNYLQTPEDRQVAAAGLLLTRKIMAQPAMARYQPEEYLPGTAASTEQELEQAAARIGTTIFHPVGTCKMGVDDMAVVDPRLRVHGVQNLRVIDASIMPTITSGNTNSPTIMIAEKGARMVLEDAG